MSFILVPSRGTELHVNGWNWRPTLLLLHARGLIDDEQHERMGANACGGRADADLAGRIAGCLDAEVARMKPGERLSADLVVTAAPQPLDLGAPAVDSYSASYEWLVRFRDFCGGSEGFEVL
jgi:hypothetical protein